MLHDVLLWTMLCNVISQTHPLQQIQFDEVTIENFDTPQTIGWIKILSCFEGHYTENNFEYYYTTDDILELLPYAISMKIVPANSIFNLLYEQYALIAKPCSNPILSLNNQKELSFTINENTGKISGAAKKNNWVGTSDAKARLAGGCFPSDPHLFAGGDAYDYPWYIYQTCDDFAGLQIIPELNWCEWETGYTVNEDVEIYLGFDVNKTTYCNATIFTKPLQNISTVTETLKRDIRCNDTDNMNLLQEIEFDEITTLQQYNIGWKKMISCEPGSSANIIFHNDYAVDDIKALLPYVLSIKISPLFNSPKLYEDYALYTQPCSETIFAINNKKEMTWKLDKFNFKILNNNYSIEDNWNGSSVAKSRLTLFNENNNCRRFIGLDYARDFPVIYSNCDAGININLESGNCQWDVNNSTVHGDIAIHFGFDAGKEQKCDSETNNVNVTYSENFVLVPHALNGFDAQLFCEQNFDSTLAVISTDELLEEALNLRYSAGLDGVDMWIGLHKPYSLDYHHWHWYGNYSDKICYYPSLDGRHDECVYDPHWFTGFPLLDASDNMTSMCAAIWGYGTNIDAYISYSCGYKNSLFLCNRHDTIRRVEPEQCSYYYQNEVNIEKGMLLTKNITIGMTNKFSFEIQLNNGFKCSTERCNIFQIGSKSEIKMPALFIKGNDLEIYFYDSGFHWAADVITNGLETLCDGEYHKIDMMFTDVSRIYIIDGISYYFEESFYEFSEFVGVVNPFYVSSPWANFVDGKIKNVCITTNFITLPPFKWHYSKLFENKDEDANPWQIVSWDGKLYSLSMKIVGTLWVYTLLYTDYTVESTKFSDQTETQIHSVQIDFGNVKPKLQKPMPTGIIDIFLIGWEPGIVIQDKNTMHLVHTIDDDINTAIYTFNLTTLMLQKTTIIPLQYNITYNDEYYPCVAADDRYLYIVLNGITLYDKSDGIFVQTEITESELILLSSGCAITNDQTSMFIFGGINNTTRYGNAMLSDQVYEYNIRADSLILLGDIKLQTPTYLLTAVITPDNRIFLSGGVSNNSQIFNVVTKQFETYYFENLHSALANLFYPSVVYDKYNNVLLSLVRQSLYRLTDVNPVSIDFSVTKSLSWRQNVLINYILFDYTEYNGLYKFMVQITGNVKYVMMIDSIYKDCYLCESTQWNVGCTVCTIAINDTNIDEIKINITSINPYMHFFGNATLDVEFAKCIVDFQINPLANDMINIKATPRNADLCASNPSTADAGYLAHIACTTAGIDHVVILAINESCLVCSQNIKDNFQCTKCLDGIETSVSADFNESSLIFEISTKTTDLIVYPESIIIPYNDTSKVIVQSFKEPLSPLEIIGIVAAICFILCAGGFLFYIYKKNKKLKDEVQKQKEQTQIISNPLVISIGVAFYETETQLKADLDVHCPDLDGVDRDAFNIKTLCEEFNYDLYPKFDEFPQLEWTQDQYVKILQKAAARASNNNYDSILAFFSGHGYSNNVITSDYKTINKDAIQALFVLTQPSLQLIPKVFVFDCCDGDSERHGNKWDDEESSSESSSESESKLDTDVGKNFSIKHIKQLDGCKHPKNDEKNANIDLNFKVACVHAANPGFQSKLNAIDGSYLINKFVSKMLETIDDEKDEFLGNIMDDIQTELHQEGKQYPSCSYCDNTRYLIFKPNGNDAIENDMVAKNNADIDKNNAEEIVLKDTNESIVNINKDDDECGSEIDLNLLENVLE